MVKLKVSRNAGFYNTVKEFAGKAVFSAALLGSSAAILGCGDNASRQGNMQDAPTIRGSPSGIGGSTKTGGVSGTGGTIGTGGTTGTGGSVGTGGMGGGAVTVTTCGKTYTFSTLISETGDRTLGDRGLAGEALSNYPLTTAETSSEAHPFADGISGTSLAQIEPGFYKIDGSNFDALKQAIAVDSNAGKNYIVTPAVFVRTENKYTEFTDGVDGKLRNFIYQVKFTQDNFGIPLCTSHQNSNWATCNSSSPDSTANHKVRMRFLGSEWVITDMITPGTVVSNENQVVSGGSVTLAKESVSGIVNVGETLTAGAYTIRLDDIKLGSTASEQGAIVSLLDSSGSVLKQQVIAPGSTATLTITPQGERIMVRVFGTALGATFSAKWADMAIISNELILRNNDIPEVNGDKTANANWRTLLTWKNRDISTDSAQNGADHLRSIILHKDNASGFTQKGGVLSEIATGYGGSGLRMQYSGLDLDRLSSKDYDNFTVTRITGTFNYNPQATSVSSREANSTSYLKIKSATQDAFSTSSGTGSELIVLFDNGTDRNKVLSSNSGFAEKPALTPGDVLLRLDNGAYAFAGSASTERSMVEVKYGVAGGSGNAAGGGAVVLAYANEAFSTNSFTIMVSEDGGEFLSAQKADAFSFSYNIGAGSLNTDNGRYAKDKVLYTPVSAFSTSTNIQIPKPDSRYTLESRDSQPSSREIGFTTERGSIIEGITDTAISVKIATRVGHIGFSLCETMNETIVKK